MWEYPKNAKHQAAIDQRQETHDRELAKAKAAEKKQMRAADGQLAMEEIKAKLAATREQTARLRAERLARAAAASQGSVKTKSVRKKK